MSGTVLLLLTHYLRNGVPDDCAGLLKLLLGQADGHAHLQRGRDHLLWLEVVFQGLEAGDQDSVCQTLHEYQCERDSVVT